ncbi:hypothetical protein L596_029870 [Steinernema carpocapsae]|uniref:Uncharacterized protein n=1 Tax=Steinernema carpocapsae TaxID=34508 RepID=A0A4V5ZX50_STECR|nr:hypothetical protein L596_029870 [Steinernema carpocapsae]
MVVQITSKEIDNCDGNIMDLDWMELRGDLLAREYKPCSLLLDDILPGQAVLLDTLSRRLCHEDWIRRVTVRNFREVTIHVNTIQYLASVISIKALILDVRLENHFIEAFRCHVDLQQIEIRRVPECASSYVTDIGFALTVRPSTRRCFVRISVQDSKLSLFSRGAFNGLECF